LAAVLVDSNVLLDVITEDGEWLDWSAAALERAAAASPLAINPIIYAEVSIGFDRIEDLDASLPDDYFERRALPWAAAASALPATAAKAVSRRLPSPVSTSGHTRRSRV
jgi:predicted nucleic acid-binding protein